MWWNRVMVGDMSYLQVGIVVLAMILIIIGEKLFVRSMPNKWRD
jgi:hypothetical protein